MEANKSHFESGVSRPRLQSGGRNRRVVSVTERAATSDHDHGAISVRRPRPALDSWFEQVEVVLGTRGPSDGDKVRAPVHDRQEVGCLVQPRPGLPRN